MFISADIFDEVTPDIEDAGLDCECLGGGRIHHDASKKKIEIFGYSQVSSVQKNLNIKTVLEPNEINKSGFEIGFQAQISYFFIQCLLIS